MKNLYKKIIEQLTSADAKTKYTVANIPVIKLVAEFEGQYYNPENTELFTTPAVLVEHDINYTNIKEPGTLRLTIHLCYEQVKPANNRSFNINNDLKYYDFNDITYNLLKNLETETTGKLKLISEGNLKEPAIVKVHLLNFECAYIGKMTNTEQNYELVTGEDVEVTGELVEKTNDNPDYGFDL